MNIEYHFYAPIEVYKLVRKVKGKLEISWSKLLIEGVRCLKEHGFIADYYIFRKYDQLYYRNSSYDLKKGRIPIKVASARNVIVKDFRETYGLTWNELAYQSILCLNYEYENKFNELTKVDIICKRCNNVITVNAININGATTIRWIPPICPNCKLVFNAFRVDLKIKS